MTIVVLLIGIFIGKFYYPYYLPYYYEILFISTLLCSIIFSLSNRINIYSSLLLFLNWIISINLWGFDPNYIWQSTVDSITSMALYRNGFNLLAIIFSISSIVGIITYIGFIPLQSSSFYGFSYPEILSTLGHLANLIHGASCGDSGSGNFKRSFNIYSLGLPSSSRHIHNI